MLVRRALSATTLIAASLALGAVTGAPADGAVAAAHDFWCHGLRATIVGHPRSEVLKGTPGDDVIVARGGDDLIRAHGGDDVVCGGKGKDVLIGGPGDDLLLGQGDFVGEEPTGTVVVGDQFEPGPGRDRVVGGYDPRQAKPGSFPDIVRYSTATRAIVARLAGPGGVGVVIGQGRDLIAGQPVQGISGGRYDDLLIGSSASDRIAGEAGQDVLRGRGGDDEILDGSNWAAKNADADVLAGGGGDDVVSSRFGVDRVSGGPGDDHLWVAPGCHTVLPGAGDDWLELTTSQSGVHETDFTFDAAQGQIQPAPGAMACGSFGAFDAYRLGSITAHITFLGTQGADLLHTYGNGVTANLYGGDDVADGTAQDDLFFAGDGNDTVDAEDGQDVCVDTELATSCESSTAP